MSWADARRKVAPKTLEKLASWRGDKDDEPDQMEDILREVVIISDDEGNDDDDDGDDMDTDEPEATFARARAGRDHPEVAQQLETARYKERPQNSTLASGRPVDQQKFIDYTPYAYPVVHDTRRHERYQVWEQARGRLRLAGHPSHPPEQPLGLYDGLTSHSPLKQSYEAPQAFRPQQKTYHPETDTGALTSDRRIYVDDTHPYQPYNHLRKEVRTLPRRSRAWELFLNVY